MIDLNAPLGRDVPTAKQVIEVIRPHLRLSYALGKGTIDAMRMDVIEHDEDLNLTDGGDLGAADAVFKALQADAMVSVKQWAGDMGLVFDAKKVEVLIRDALLAAESNLEALPGGFKALEY